MNHLKFSLLGLLLCLSGCAISGKHTAVTPVHIAPTPVGDDFANAPAAGVIDPLQGFNRTAFALNDKLNLYALRPLSRGYALIVPLPARTSISNFFDNVQFPVRFVNCVLQGKIIRSAQETGKFVINSTAGVGGLFRVSDHVSGFANIPAEDFGQTLGVWGLPPGPYLVLVGLGPSDLRDLVGFGGDLVISPLNWHAIGIIRHAFISDSLSIALGATRYVNALPKSLEAYDQMKSEAVDPYVAMRDGYLSYRAAQVRK